MLWTHFVFIPHLSPLQSTGRLYGHDRPRRMPLQPRHYDTVDRQGMDLGGSEISAGWITLRFLHTSMSAEEPVLGLECSAHKILRRSSSEIASRPPDLVSDLGGAVRCGNGGFRKKADEITRVIDRKDRPSSSEPDVSKSDWKSERADHDGSVWRFPVPGVPRLF